MLTNFRKSSLPAEDHYLPEVRRQIDVLETELLAEEDLAGQKILQRRLTVLEEVKKCLEAQRWIP